ncbi:MAG: DNA polymerase III subunit chi [Burkholderiales bacterium]|nr:DNA polymerase III subunit chi [Burkholderiales bacterium]
MPDITFHTQVPDRLAHACRVARKALRAQRHLAIVGPAEVLEQVDSMLWNMAPQDFVAHCRADSADPALLQASRIVLALPGQALACRDMLLNLCHDVPEGWAAFAQVVEVVSADDEHDKQRARQRWRCYRELGHEPVQHDLGQKTV